MKHYEILVGNIGTVHSGPVLREAERLFVHYRKQSQSGSGRASGENVTLLRVTESDVEILDEYIGTLHPRP